MDRYTNYTTEDFLADDSFIQWLLQPSEEQEKFWRDYLDAHPEKKKTIEEARFIFSIYQVEQKKLNLDETYEIWNKILRSSKKGKGSGWIGFLKYAAVFVLIFLSGALSYSVYESKRQAHFDFAMIPEPPENEAKIVLSDGSEVSLEKKESEITYSSSGDQLIVNQDTIRQNRLGGKEMMNKVIIPYGKKSMIRLSDGTQVWLNAGSQLVYPSVFLRDKREVVLIGEAYFDVSKNKSKPFVVRTSEMHVTVLGTKFDVSAYPEDRFSETILEEGSISLEITGRKFLNSGKKILLKPNEKLSLNREEGVMNLSEVDVSMYTSWKDGMLKAEKEDLVRVLKKVERYYNIHIEIKDPLAGGYIISGKLDLKSSPEEVMNVIKLTVPVDWTKKSNGDFVIVRK